MDLSTVAPSLRGMLLVKSTSEFGWDTLFLDSGEVPEDKPRSGKPTHTRRTVENVKPVRREERAPTKWQKVYRQWLAALFHMSKTRLYWRPQLVLFGRFWLADGRFGRLIWPDRAGQLTRKNLAVHRLSSWLVTYILLSTRRKKNIE